MEWNNAFLGWAWVCLALAAVSYLLDSSIKHSVTMFVLAGACFLTAIAIKD